MNDSLDANDSMEVVLENDNNGMHDGIPDIFPSASSSSLSTPYPLSSQAVEKRQDPTTIVSDNEDDECNNEHSEGAGSDDDDLHMAQLVNISGDFASPSKSTFATATSAVAAAISEPLEKLNTSIEEQVNTSLDTTMACCQWMCQDMGNHQVEQQDGNPPALISPEAAAEGTPVRELWEEQQHQHGATMGRQQKEQHPDKDDSTTSRYLKQTLTSDTATTRPVDNRSPNRNPSSTTRRSLFRRNIPTTHSSPTDAVNVTASLIVSDSDESEGEDDNENAATGAFPTMDSDDESEGEDDNENSTGAFPTTNVMEKIEENGESSGEETNEGMFPSDESETSPNQVSGDKSAKDTTSLDDPEKTNDNLQLPIVRESQGSPEKSEKQLAIGSRSGELKSTDPIFVARTMSDAQEEEPHLISFESSVEGNEESVVDLDDSYNGVYYGEEDELEGSVADSYDGVCYGEDSQEDLALQTDSASGSQIRAETFENSLFVSADTTPEEFAAMELRLAAMHGEARSSVTKGEYDEDSLVLSQTIDSASVFDPRGMQYLDQMNSTLQSVEEAEEEEDETSSSGESEVLGKEGDNDGQTEGATASETASYEPFSCDQSPLKCDTSTFDEPEPDRVEDHAEKASALQENDSKGDSEVDPNVAMDMLLEETNNYIQDNNILYNETSPEMAHPNKDMSAESIAPQNPAPSPLTPPRIASTIRPDDPLATPPSLGLAESNISFESAQEDVETILTTSDAEESIETELAFMTPNKISGKRLSFADDHGQPLELVKQLMPRQESTGRLVVLLLDPLERIFEFVLLEYPVDETTTAEVLTEQLSALATNTTFQYTQYIGLSRIKGNKADEESPGVPIRDEVEDGSSSTTVTVPPVPTILDANTLLGDAGFRNCELVLAVPRGSTCEEMITHAFPLLLNGTITKALQSGRRSGRGLKKIQSANEWEKNNSFAKSVGQGEHVRNLASKSREWNIVWDISESVLVFGEEVGDYADNPEELWQLADDDAEVFLHWVEEEDEDNITEAPDDETWENETENFKLVLFPQPEPDPIIWNYVGGKDGAERLIFAFYFAVVVGVMRLALMGSQN